MSNGYAISDEVTTFYLYLAEKLNVDVHSLALGSVGLVALRDALETASGVIVDQAF